MAAEQSIMSYFFDAGLTIKLVLLILVAASFISWVFIFQRSIFLKRARRELVKFEERFWQTGELARLYAQMDNPRIKRRGLNAIFLAGYKAFSSSGDTINNDAKQRSVMRAMRVASSKEIDQLEKHLAFLASVGSVSPYIGLFGTVWGIMSAFKALGNVQSANIAMVAPGISEALVVTAMGLFAAIPAVLAYNRFSNQVERLVMQYEIFQDELSNTFERLYK